MDSKYTDRIKLKENLIKQKMRRSHDVFLKGNMNQNREQLILTNNKFEDEVDISVMTKYFSRKTKLEKLKIESKSIENYQKYNNLQSIGIALTSSIIILIIRDYFSFQNISNMYDFCDLEQVKIVDQNKYEIHLVILSMLIQLSQILKMIFCSVFICVLKFNLVKNTIEYIHVLSVSIIFRVIAIIYMTIVQQNIETYISKYIFINEELVEDVIYKSLIITVIDALYLVSMFFLTKQTAKIYEQLLDYRSKMMNQNIVRSNIMFRNMKII